MGEILGHLRAKIGVRLEGGMEKVPKIRGDYEQDEGRWTKKV